MGRKGCPCTVNGVEYEAKKVAARALGIPEATLHHRLRSPSYPEYASEYHVKVNVRRKGRPCTINGVEYISEQAAAGALGTSPSTMRYRLRSSNFPQYIPHRHPKVARKPKKRPCTVSGVEYESEMAAARVFDVRASVLRCRLRSSNYPEYISRYHPKEERRKRFVSCSVAGVEYASVSDASRKLGIADHEMRRRLASTDFPTMHAPRFRRSRRSLPDTLSEASRT